MLPLSSLQTWWLVMAAAAAAIAVAGVFSRWRATAALAALLLAGGSAQLGLTEPLWYQFVWIRPTGPFQLVLWGAVLLQGLVAAAAFLRSSPRRTVLQGVEVFGAGRLLLFGALSLAVAVGAMRYIGDRAWADLAKQLAASTLFLGVNLATVLALARSVPLETLASRATGILDVLGATQVVDDPMPHLDRWAPLAAAGFVFTAASLLSLFAFQHTPRLADEVCNLFQARYFAHGWLYAPAPPGDAVAALKHDFLVVQDGRWYSIFPPGWSAILALGVLAGVPWLVNPLLAAVSILATHAIVSRLASRGLAHLTILLMAVSPWFLAMSASLMSHTATLALALGGVWCLLRARERNAAWALLAGALMGLLFLTRPVEGLVGGVAAGLWSLGLLRNARGWRIVIGYGLGCAAVGALIFPYNLVLVGDPLTTPIDAYFDALWHAGANRLGFGPDIGPPNGWGGIDIYPGHSPLEALISAQQSAYMLDFEMLGWGIGSLSLVFAQLLWGRPRPLTLALLGVTMAIALMIGLYWFNDSFYIGPRYWFFVFAPLAVISAQGLTTVGQRLNQAQGPDAARRLIVAVAILGLFGAGAFTSWRGVTRYFQFRGFTADYQTLARENNFGRALVFVKTASDPDFSSAFAVNSPDLTAARPLFVRDQGEAANRRTAGAFPGRTIYKVQGRDATASSARVVSGPAAQP